MAYHIRKTIRETIKSYLTNTIAGQNVFFDSPDVIAQNQLPCISIYSESEGVTTDTIGYPSNQTRTLQISIIGFVKTNQSTQDKIDQLTFEIESGMALTKDRVNLDGLVMWCLLIQTDFDVSNEAELDFSTVKLTYEVKYQTLQNTPDKTE